MAMTVEERRARLRQRTQQSAQDRGQRGLGRNVQLPLDLSGVNVVWYELTATPRATNLIDIVPFEISQPWYAQMRQFTGRATGRVPGDWDYKLEVCVHKKIGVAQQPVLCLREMFGQKCPICDEMFEEYRKRGNPSENFNQKKAEALQPQWRCVYKVYDYRDEKHDGFKLWDVAYKTFEEYLMEKAENDPSGYVTFSDPFDGNVLEIEGRVKKIGKNDFIEPASLRFLPREQPYAEEDIAIMPLDKMLIVPSYEEVCAIYYEMHTPSPTENTNGNAPPAEEPSPEPSRLARRPATPEARPSGNPCPAGGTFGADYQKYDICQSTCPDDTFNACADAWDKMQAATPPPPPSPPPPQEEPPAPARRRATTLPPQPDDTQPPTTPMRRRR